MHVFRQTVVAPTCQAGGYTSHVCTICGYSFNDAHTLPVDHHYENGFCIWCGALQPGSIMNGEILETPVEWD